MILRTACQLRARLTALLALMLAALVSTMAATSVLAQASIDLKEGFSVRTSEVQGFLAGKGDVHYLGLEPAEGIESIVVTLVYRTPEGSLLHDGVNFSVLDEDGLSAYFSGLSLDEAARVTGTLLRAGPRGTIAQATVGAHQPAGYTIIVGNSWQAPVSYLLTVHGGTLVDEGGQTLLRMPEEPESPDPDAVDLEPLQTVPEMGPIAPADPQERYRPAGIASTIHDTLQPLTDRHVFALQPTSTDGEISVSLSYQSGGPVSPGMVNFWLLTQDGLQHVSQGALLTELYLATGKPSASGQADEMVAKVRLGAPDEYVLIVFNESPERAEYQLDVTGAVVSVSNVAGDSVHKQMPEQSAQNLAASSAGLAHVAGE